MRKPRSVGNYRYRARIRTRVASGTPGSRRPGFTLSEPIAVSISELPAGLKFVAGQAEPVGDYIVRAAYREGLAEGMELVLQHNSKVLRIVSATGEQGDSVRTMICKTVTG